ncbi:MAG: signal peptidase I [Akkermansiaceae bacterium]
MFTPKWKKEALLLLKGAQKFEHYKRDLLEAEKIGEIKSRQDDLKKAIKAKDQAAVKEASKQLRNTCEKSLSHYTAPNALEENLEVFWVAIVIALGVRAYFVQPFKIPTGSMQPSLNGIIADSKHLDEEWETPWFGKQVFDYVAQGRSYSNVVADKDKRIVAVKDVTKFIFSRTCIRFDDGSDIVISSPLNEALSIPTIKPYIAGINRRGLVELRPGPHYKKGDPIFKGTLTSGDLVLVDKFSYHFRQPERGESFVFNTRGIDTDGVGSAMQSQKNATHYIKRLVGVPGDKIRVAQPDIYINGVLPKEEAILRVASEENDYEGYFNIHRKAVRLHNYASKEYEYELKSPENRNQREFFAFGDNSENSLDSRYWGSVKQYNLVGPALFSLWPFKSGHWGFIE